MCRLQTDEMCVCVRAGVTHSATSDMTVIEQDEAPARSQLDDIDDFSSAFTMIRYPAHSSAPATLYNTYTTITLSITN